MGKAIFVVGNNRSGTKWLSNILLNHKNIAGIQLDYHRGILETNMFHHMERTFGGLRRVENFIGFVECLSATDFFRITGLSKDFLYRSRCRDYPGLFKRLMDEYAREKGTGCWLQKIHATALEKVYKNFNDALFIIIERNLADTIRSAYVLQKRTGNPTRLLREVLIYHYSRKIRKKFGKKKNVINVTYEELLSEPEMIVRKICEFLKIDYSPGLLDVGFKKNTSFKKESDRARLFPRYKAILLKITAPVFRLFPFFIYEFLFQLNKTFKTCGSRFLAGTFSMICDERGFEKVEY